MASPQPAPLELPALERIPLDRRARVLACLIRWRARMPDWEIGVLELLAATEADSVGMLRASLVRTADPRLRRLIERHIADESRHADLFATRLIEVAGRRRADPKRDVRGPLSVLQLMAYFEITERRGAQALQVFRVLFDRDGETQRIIDSVLRDERVHVAYTRDQLDRWSREGHAEDVARARRWARRIDDRAAVRQCLAFAAVLPSLIANEFRRLVRPAPSEAGAIRRLG